MTSKEASPAKDIRHREERPLISTFTTAVMKDITSVNRKYAFHTTLKLKTFYMRPDLIIIRFSMSALKSVEGTESFERSEALAFVSECYSSENSSEHSETTAIERTIRNRNGHLCAHENFMMENSHINIPRGDYTVLDIKQIQEIIPHRPPFLLVDKIVELEDGKRAVGLKNVTINEPFFIGHFPEYPVMPGVLITEALAQVGAVAILNLEGNKGKIGFLAGLDNFRFRGQVVPGDTLMLEVEITRLKGSIGKGKATAKVGDKVVAEGEIMFALSDPS